MMLKEEGRRKKEEGRRRFIGDSDKAALRENLKSANVPSQIKRGDISE
jgi:hypothetical protein